MLSYKNQFDLVFSNAALHWIADQGSILRGIRASLKPSGSCRGNAQDILAIANRCITEKRWQSYFTGFVFPYHFFSPEEYAVFLQEAGLIAKRLELIPKDMTQLGREGFAGWIRTTWLPFTDRIPEQKRDLFIAELIDAYLREFPLDKGGAGPHEDGTAGSRGNEGGGEDFRLKDSRGFFLSDRFLQPGS